MVASEIWGSAMPKFFVDLDDGVVCTSDDDGVEACDLDEAKRKVLAALPQIARDAVSKRDSLAVAARIRDESGRVCITAVLKIEVATHL